MNLNYLGKLGSGSYGDVFLMQSIKNKEEYRALKILRDIKNIDDKDLNESNDLLIEIFNQLKIQELNLPYIPQLRELYFNDTTKKWYFHYDFFDMDLHRYIKENVISLPQIKSIAYQLLECIDKLHSQKIVHRDIKPNNILLTKTGVVGLCDFGISMTNFNNKYTYPREVCTLWYRPPELILDTHYSTKIDIWSIGCVIAELLDRRALFPYSTATDLINGIYYKMGTPTKDHSPALLKMKNYSHYKSKYYHDNFRWKTYLNIISDKDKLLADLLSKMIVLDPEERISAKDALKHEYFKDTLLDIPFNTKIKYDILREKYIFNSSKYTLINYKISERNYLSLDFLATHKKINANDWLNNCICIWRYISQIDNYQQRMLVYISTISFIAKHMYLRDNIKIDYIGKISQLISKYYRVVYCDIRSREIEKNYSFLIEVLKVDGFGIETDYLYQIVINYFDALLEDSTFFWKLIWLLSIHYPLLKYLTPSYMTFLHSLIIKNKVIPIDEHKYLDEIKMTIGNKKYIFPHISKELHQIYEIIDLLNFHT